MSLTDPTTSTTTERTDTFASLFGELHANIARVIQGKDDVIDLLLISLVAEGHLLLEDVPGVGKTSLAKALAASIDAPFGRIQFTPDLLPTDVTGVNVWHRGAERFEFHRGPIFANVVVADEINRASPKTQSALLEAMEERQVTVDGHRYPLAAPFIVIATQNPIEQEGTYALPESQLDRFLMKVSLGYPDRTAEVRMLQSHGEEPVLDSIGPVLSTAQVAGLIAAAARSTSPTAARLPRRPRRRLPPPPPSTASVGMSPRSTLALQRAARARAATRNRGYVIPDDIKALAEPVLAHRILLTPEAQVAGLTTEEIVAELTASVPQPAPQRAAGRRPDAHPGGLADAPRRRRIGRHRTAPRPSRALRARRRRRRPRRDRRDHGPSVAARPGDRAGGRAPTGPPRRREPRRAPRRQPERAAQPDVAPARPGRGHRRRPRRDDIAAGRRPAHAATYRLPTDRRGLLDIGPLQARRTDPFGVASRTTEVAGPAHLTVLPSVEPLHRLPESAGVDDPLAGASRPIAGSPGGGGFAALREYVAGDDLRRVHWPSSARTGDLLVRKEDPPWQGHLTLLLDARAGHVSAERFEYAVTGAASIVHAVSRLGDRIRLLITDGTDSGLVDARAARETLLEHLALVEVHDDAASLPVPPLDGRRHTGTLVVLTGRLDAADLDLLRTLRTRFATLLVVVVGPEPAVGDADVAVAHFAGDEPVLGRHGTRGLLQAARRCAD